MDQGRDHDNLIAPLPFVHDSLKVHAHHTQGRALGGIVRDLGDVLRIADPYFRFAPAQRGRNWFDVLYRVAQKSK